MFVFKCKLHVIVTGVSLTLISYGRYYQVENLTFAFIRLFTGFVIT